MERKFSIMRFKKIAIFRREIFFVSEYLPFMKFTTDRNKWKSFKAKSGQHREYESVGLKSLKMKGKIFLMINI